MGGEGMGGEGKKGWEVKEGRMGGEGGWEVKGGGKGG